MFQIILISLSTGSGSMFIYYLGLKKIKAIIATIMELFYPLSAVVFDYLINGNVLSTVQIVSALVMLYAIFNLNVDNARAIARVRVKIRNARKNRKLR